MFAGFVAVEAVVAFEHCFASFETVLAPPGSDLAEHLQQPHNSAAAKTLKSFLPFQHYQTLDSFDSSFEDYFELPSFALLGLGPAYLR